MRTLRTEHNVDEQLNALKISYERFDALIEAISDVLCKYPETFIVIPGTKLSWCRTNEFVGVSFTDIPVLSMYFHYDNDHVYLLAIEECKVNTFGFPSTEGDQK